jgi:SHAQKYF class myb-like DNA-binding protein
MALFDYALHHASPKKIMKMMPDAYPSSLTTEHVKSHLQKLRVKSKCNRDLQFKVCDDLLSKEYDIQTGKYINDKHPLTEDLYDLVSSRFAIAYEMLSEPERFANEMSSGPKLQKQTSVINEESNCNFDNNAVTEPQSDIKRQKLESSGSSIDFEKTAQKRRNSFQASLASMKQNMENHKRISASHNTQLLKYSYQSRLQSVNPSSPTSTNISSATNSSSSSSPKSNVVDALDALMNIPAL